MSFADLREVLKENQSHTHPEHPDTGLRGRTYAIPFTKVWGATVEFCSRESRGWTLVMNDEDLGVLRAECKTMPWGWVHDLEVRMSLDENAQTRVDVSAISRGEKPDLGLSARRIRKLFRFLDKRLGAGPGKIIDPTLPLIRTTLLLLGLLAGCSQSEEISPGIPSAEPDSLAPIRNFQSRSYERHIVFLTFRGDSTLLVPWTFAARTKPEGVDREIRGWLARSDTWDPFLEDHWAAPLNSAPWRILPQGPVRLVVGQADALETIIFQDGGRNLEVNLGELLAEWAGQRAQTFRVHEGTIILSDQTVEGHVLDLTRAWAAGDTPPGDWGILLSGDTLQVVLENQATESGPEGGAFSVWARVEFLDRQWQDVRLPWSEVRAFEPARRDIPMSWEIESPDGDFVGSLTTLSPFLEATEGEGPMLPVDALYQVSGILTLDGADFPVQGFIRHLQR